MIKKLLGLSPELVAALDLIAEGNGGSFAPNVERLLWRLKEVREAAEEAGVENPKRPLDGRGGKR